MSVSPDVAAKSSLHVRVTSNTGTPLETAITNCELKAIIETEIGIIITPYSICFVRQYPKQYFKGKERSRLCEIGPIAPTSFLTTHHAYRGSQLPIAARRELSRNGLRIKATALSKEQCSRYAATSGRKSLRPHRPTRSSRDVCINAQTRCKPLRQHRTKHRCDKHKHKHDIEHAVVKEALTG